MASSSTGLPDIDDLSISDPDADNEDLWASPSAKIKSNYKPRSTSPSKEPASESDGRDLPSPRKHPGTRYESLEERESALRKELESVRAVNTVIEGVVESLETAKKNMNTVSRTVQSASALLDTWQRILSLAEHNQRLILNPEWQGLTQDLQDIENEAIARQQEAERREAEERQRKEAAARKREEEERKREREAGTRSAGSGRLRGYRGIATGSGRARGGNRAVSSAAGRYGNAGAHTGTSTGTKRSVSMAYGRGTGPGNGTSHTRNISRTVSTSRGRGRGNGSH